MNKETGNRSPAMSEERGEFAHRLGENLDNLEDYCVIVLMEHNDKEEFEFSQAPLLDAAHFVQLFDQGNKDNG